MSKPSLAGRGQQQSSPFGLGHKQAKKIRRKCATVAPYLLCARLGSHPRPGEQEKAPKKIRSKCATVARYSMLYRFLCNAMQRDGVKPSPDLAFGALLLCAVTQQLGIASHIFPA